MLTCRDRRSGGKLCLMRIHGHGTGQNFQTGFTVLELMITLSVACILLLTGRSLFPAVYLSTAYESGAREFAQ